MERYALHQLDSWHVSKNRLPLIIKGARQVGKTYLVDQFAKTRSLKIHRFNFESDKELKKIFASDFLLERVFADLSLRSPSKEKIAPSDVIFFDEIQECPQALSALKYFHKERPTQPIICAGSLLGVTLHESSYPVGSVDYLWFGPLSFEEFLLGIDDQPGLDALTTLKNTLKISDTAHAHLWQQLKRFYITGGLPRPIVEFANNKSDDITTFLAIRKIQENLVRDYMNDFSKHSGDANAMYIRAIFENVPEQLASVNDGSSKKFKFGEPIAGIKGYPQLRAPIEWLDKAGLVYRIKIVHRAEIPLKAFCQENLFKLYIFDIGILATLLNLPIEAILSQDYGMTKGYFAESLGLQGLIQNELNLPICWMEGQSEVEFLLTLHGEIVPIEIKSGLRTKAKSLDAYIARYQPKAAVKLYAGTPNFNNAKRLHLLPLYLAWNIHELKLF